MKKISTLFLNFSVLVTFAVLALSPGLAFASEGASDGASDVASITAVPQVYDFGDIIPENGLVSADIVIANNGSETITLNRLSTSCGCTTADMDMSELLPGEERTMLVTFDPSVHPDQSGPMTRVVYLQSSDPILPELEIDFGGNVVRDVDATEQSPALESNLSAGDAEVVVFFNEACQDCGELVHDKYPAFFGEYGLSLVKKDYINERDNRELLNQYNEEWGVPFELQSHIEAFIGENLLIGGHVPEDVISYLLDNPDQYERLLVYQDKMHGEGVDYRVWDFKTDIRTYPLDEPITTYLESDKSSGGGDVIKSASFWGLFAVITSSAFLDGINPCAIAVLLFFIAFLFSIKRTKQSIWKMGFVYIGGIFLAYLLIGLGIAQAIIISGAPHLMAYIGAYLVIALGVIQLLSVAFPRFPIKLRIPINTKATMEKWMYKATLPAALVGGFIVGLCTFPCSGGIYVAIIGMLASSQSYTQGLGWMIWYNLIFILPLIILLFMAANPRTTDKLQKWERKESKNAKVLIGLTMIGLGLVIILFFT